MDLFQRTGLMLLLFIAAVVGMPLMPASAESTDTPTEVPPVQDAEAEPEPPHLADPAAFRRHAALDMLCELFAIKVEPEPGDAFLDLMPKGTKPVELVNPGFEFTFDNGKKPGRNFWIIVVREDQPGHIQGGMRGPSDPIKGWTAHGCAGLESGRPKQWQTTPDGCTGYMVAHGKDYWLHQTIAGALKPNTRYTLLVEVYKRNDYKRAEQDEIIMRLVDKDGKALDTDTADLVINPADPETGFAICAITLTTTADQKPGDLQVHLGMNAEGGIRLNYDNARLWAQPLE